MTKTIVIPHNKAFVDYLIKHGYVEPDVEVEEDLRDASIRGKDVIGNFQIGNMSVRRARKARSITEFNLKITPDMIGRELTLSDIEKVVKPPKTYAVTALPALRKLKK